MTQVYKIRVIQILGDLEEYDVLTVRVYGDYDTVEKLAEDLRTEWLRQNPGRPATWSITSGPSMGHR